MSVWTLSPNIFDIILSNLSIMYLKSNSFKNTISISIFSKPAITRFFHGNLFRLSLIFTAIFMNHWAFSQKPTYYMDFDKSGFEEVITQKKEAVFAVDLQQSQFAKGLKGKALDLSANAILRRPIKINKEKLPSIDDKSSFSVQIWIKTLPNAKMGTPILGNKKASDFSSAGWQLYTQPNGAWSFNLNDGKSRYDYIPTTERQRINDGKWHQIVFSLDRVKQEVWMYLDGKNVAIYNTPGLKSLESEFFTVIGGTDEEWDQGYYGQWNAFNGFIDEVKFWDTVINAKEVRSLYGEFHPKSDQHESSYEPQHLKVLAWNIWHGGHRYGKEVGLDRVIETIKSTNSDVIGLIETYGSGAVIADSLGYYYYLISTNLSIMSRYPITETITAFKPFNFGGVNLKISPTKNLIFFDTWLHYKPVYSANVVKKNFSSKDLIAAESATRHSEIKEILGEIAPFLVRTEDTPVIMVGDFNVGSHLDWTKETSSIHYNKVVEWPVSKEMLKAGFKDSFRELHINPLVDPGLTWTPRAATSSDKYGLRDRIDYIYYQGTGINPVMSKVIDYHPVMFPSDHAAVVTVFHFK